MRQRTYARCTHRHPVGTGTDQLFRERSQHPAVRPGTCGSHDARFRIYAASSGSTNAGRFCVKVITLNPETVGLTTDLPGRVVAYRVAEIRPQVSGVIQKRMFTEGTDVKAGRQLYQINSAPYRVSYEGAAAIAMSSKLSGRWL